MRAIEVGLKDPYLVLVGVLAVIVVWGLIALVDEISSPARALSRLDFPDPVPPAIATAIEAPR